MENKFVIWGCGFRGKLLFDILGHNRVAAFIDRNAELVGTEYKGVKIIDFDEYLEKFREYFIVISILEPEEIEKFLQKQDVYSYFCLSDCPEEFQGYGDINLLKKIDINWNVEKNVAIYGINLFGVLLFGHLKKKGKETYLIPSFEMKEEILEEFKKIFCDIPVKKLQQGTEVVLNTLRQDQKRLETCNSEKLKIENMYDFSDRIPEYFHKEIEKYRDIHKGKRCFIVATGPSLTMEDLNTLWKNKEICFSMNRIYCAFKETEWRPDYYVVQDRKMLECYWEDILGLDINDKFISDRVLYLFDEKKKKEALKRVDVNLFHLQGGEAIQRNIMFSEDFAKKCYEGWTVTYACIQLAVYMGFSEIYLLGVDCNYIAGSVAQQNYFSKDYVQEDKKGSAPLPYLMMSAYESAKNYLDSKDRSKVYNATRGGKLEVFERVNFDELFE